MSRVRVLTASDRALLVETADLDEALRLHLALADVAGIVERVPAASSVLVRFDPRVTSAEALAQAIAELRLDAAQHAPTAEITIPVRYDGADLNEVAELLAVSPEEVVRRHLAASWRVAFAGFAPGFGYLIGNDPLFDVPRRATPRTRVPAGAVGLAGPFTGVYPRESPGGWQLIGTTDAVMWDTHRDPPALLVPGAVVRFERAGRDVVAASLPNASREQNGRLEAVRRGGGSAVDTAAAGSGEDAVCGALTPGSTVAVGGTGTAGPDATSGLSCAATATIEVTRPALQLLVQDLGRPGHAQLGVSASGVADRIAMRDANRAVGNEPHAAVLECVGGVGLGFTGNGVAAITGAIGDAVIVSAERIERSIPMGEPFATFDGDELDLASPTSGLRYVIAVRGGIRVAEELGSRSSDTLSGLGPAPLTLGSVVEVGEDAPQLIDPYPVQRSLPASGDLVELDITLGPRDDWFTPAALATLTEQEWLVTPQTDRVGMRLRGEVPLQRTVHEELPSEGAVTGAIQVPADGQPVLFLPDHPLTGGYPIIGALTDAALDLAAQLPPGVRIRFRVR